jgi:hypothetical protein
VLPGATIGIERRPKEQKPFEILIGCLDLSNKIWLTVEVRQNAFHDDDEEAGCGMRITTRLVARGIGV